jgi:prepilin-type N-terminal cleavage/methylation domain-containing protein
MFKGKNPTHKSLADQTTARSPRLTMLCLILRTRKPGEFTAGFTLLELLVAMIVGSILTLALLFSAVQLMGTNQREGARSDTQREVQAAIDYIARDLREAIYVYDGQCLKQTGTKPIAQTDPAQGNCRGLLSSLPTKLDQPNNLPILAFWRVDPIPQPLADLCVSNAKTLVDPKRKPTANDIGEANCGAKRMYTLVVYSLNKENTGKVWGGRSRITRYQLPKYTYADSATATITPGWVAPDGTESSFISWPAVGPNGITRLSLTAPTDKTPKYPPRADYWDNKVLVDFIDDPTQGNPGVVTPTATCPPGPSLPVSGTTPEQFIVTPAPEGPYSSTLPKSIFYACVRGAGAKLNQEVLVRIQANGAGRAGLNVKATELPITMETRVLTRGLVGKDS